jgi:predicted tellurium resistance membrane protein TerC
MNSTPNPLFRVVVVVSAAFLITVLMMIAAAFSSDSPIAQWINRYGVQLIGVEVVLVVAFSILAMKYDRRQSHADREQDDP